MKKYFNEFEITRYRVVDCMRISTPELRTTKLQIWCSVNRGFSPPAMFRAVIRRNMALEHWPGRQIF